jgi:hypothetical protein
MSDIRVTSTGEIFYKVDSQIANLLMAALPTVFERVEQKSAAPAAPQTPTFVARNNPHSGAPQIVMFYMGQEEFYQGSPDQTDGAFSGRARRSPPAEVVEQYRALIENEKARNRSAIHTQQHGNFRR